MCASLAPENASETENVETRAQNGGLNKNASNELSKKDDMSVMREEVEEKSDLRMSGNYKELAGVGEALQYSLMHRNSLHRGELWLLPRELEALTSDVQKFKSLGCHGEWMFKRVEPELLHPPVQTPGSKLKSGRRSAVGVRNPKRIHSQDERSKRTATETEIGVSLQSGDGATPGKEKERTSLLATARLSARASQNQLKRLPDWAQRLHRILVFMCQTELCRPFVAEIPPSHPNFANVYDAIQPALTPIGLATVVSKLEHNAYLSALDAFNDIYSVWLCAYRTHPPGSPLWLQAYQASRTFLQQIANQPLRDDFSGAPSATGKISGGAGASAKGTEGALHKAGAGHRSKQRSPNVDQILHEFLGLHDSNGVEMEGEAAGRGSSITPSGTGAGWRGGVGRTRSRKNLGVRRRSSLQKSGRVSVSSRGSGTSGVVPITEEERGLFQKYLSRLPAKYHLMLFESFRRTAVWQSIESGEVELDDARTGPAVFRKMIAWCHAQLKAEGISDPSQGSAKRVSSRGATRMAQSQQGFDGEAASLTRRWSVSGGGDQSGTASGSGSGKSVPVFGGNRKQGEKGLSRGNHLSGQLEPTLRHCTTASGEKSTEVPSLTSGNRATALDFPTYDESSSLSSSSDVSSDWSSSNRSDDQDEFLTMSPQNPVSVLCGGGKVAQGSSASLIHRRKPSDPVGSGV